MKFSELASFYSVKNACLQDQTQTKIALNSNVKHKSLTGGISFTGHAAHLCLPRKVLEKTGKMATKCSFKVWNLTWAWKCPTSLSPCLFLWVVVLVIGFNGLGQGVVWRPHLAAILSCPGVGPPHLTYPCLQNFHFPEYRLLGLF